MHCYVAPPAPTNFTVSEVIGNSSVLMASWNVPAPSNGVLLNYTLSCNGIVTGTFLHPMMSAEVSVMVTGLSANTQYNCSVVARTNGGTGNASNTDSATTVEDGKSRLKNEWVKDG